MIDEKGFKMFKKALLPLALILASGAANAGVVTNDTDILTGDDHAQLSEWLGSDFDLTRIFAKGVDGDTALDWHDSVDNKGATFTVMEVFDNDTDERLVIGGYNATSWTSIVGWGNGSGSFLFNLSSDLQYEQNARQPSGMSTTYNHGNLGVLFGTGHDLRVNGDLSTGYTNIGATYGDMSQFGSETYQEEFAGSYDNWIIGAYETFTLSASTGDFGEGATANVPVSFLLGGLGLFGLMASRRKKAI